MSRDWRTRWKSWLRTRAPAEVRRGGPLERLRRIFSPVRGARFWSLNMKALSGREGETHPLRSTVHSLHPGRNIGLEMANHMTGLHQKAKAVAHRRDRTARLRRLERPVFNGGCVPVSG